MSIYQTLLKQRNTARLEKNSQALATIQILIGEIERITIKGKLVADIREDDNLALTTFKSLHSNWTENYNRKPTPELKAEIDIINGFLPQALTESELRSIAKLLSDKSMGEYMKHLKEQFPNRYDGKIASAIFKEITG